MIAAVTNVDHTWKAAARTGATWRLAGAERCELHETNGRCAGSVLVIAAMMDQVVLGYMTDAEEVL
jgi:hypothetical protein